MMLDRMEGNAELKTSVQQMLATRRLTHSVLLVGEAGLGTGFAARCIAADYLYPAGGGYRYRLQVREYLFPEKVFYELLVERLYIAALIEDNVIFA